MVLEDILTKTDLENPRAQSERRNCVFAFQFRSSSLKRGFFMLTLYAGIFYAHFVRGDFFDFPPKDKIAA